MPSARLTGVCSQSWKIARIDAVSFSVSSHFPFSRSSLCAAFARPCSSKPDTSCRCIPCREGREKRTSRAGHTAPGISPSSPSSPQAALAGLCYDSLHKFSAPPLIFCLLKDSRHSRRRRPAHSRSPPPVAPPASRHTGHAACVLGPPPRCFRARPAGLARAPR